MKAFTVETGLGLERVEVYEHKHGDLGFLPASMEPEEGWYFGFGQPGCLYDSEPEGPFDSAREAYEAACELCEELPAWEELVEQGIV